MSGVLIMADGHRVPVNPTPDDIRLQDIIRGLSTEYRFGGHTLHPYTVAQHSVLLSELVPEEYRLVALLHDASEAYLHDMVRPYKDEMPEYRCLEDRFMRCVGEKFGFDWPIPEVVSEMDEMLYVVERETLQPGHGLWTESTRPPAAPVKIVRFHPPFKAARVFELALKEVGLTCGERLLSFS